ACCAPRHSSTLNAPERCRRRAPAAARDGEQPSSGGVMLRVAQINTYEGHGRLSRPARRKPERTIRAAWRHDACTAYAAPPPVFRRVGKRCERFGAGGRRGLQVAERGHASAARRTSVRISHRGGPRRRLSEPPGDDRDPAGGPADTAARTIADVL